LLLEVNKILRGNLQVTGYESLDQLTKDAEQIASVFEHLIKGEIVPEKDLIKGQNFLNNLSGVYLSSIE
ncbi:MAG: hypothetical protein AABX59_02860, partial [Nanoarchaeota archaeon]